MDEEKSNGVPGAKILIVEDDQFLSSIAAGRLEKEGYKIAVVGDGAQALKRLEEEIPDLILLDVIMPGMSGFEVLKKLKSDDRFKNIPVIIFSNLGQEHEIEEGKKLGAEDFLVKAKFTPKEIVERINTFLQTKKAKVPQKVG